MPRKKKVDLSQFDTLLNDMGYENTMHQAETTDVSDMLDNDDIENLDENQTSIQEQQDAEGDDGTKKDDFEDTSDVPDNVLNQ